MECLRATTGWAPNCGLPRRGSQGGRQLLLAITLAAAISHCWAGHAHPDVPAVPGEHPRVYVRAGDLPRIRRNLQSPELTPTWEAVVRSADREPVCSALIYLLHGDSRAGRRAILEGLDALRRERSVREFDSEMHKAACIYDWCYPLLSADERTAFVAEFRRLASLHTPWYPARPGKGAVVGHATEGWLLTGQLPAGVAIYDECPDMYAAAARVFLDEFVPARNFYYPGHSHHQGDSYISRFSFDIAATWLFRRIGVEGIFVEDQRFVPYQMIYWLRPDGKQLRVGDTYDETGRDSAKRLVALLTGTYYRDGYLLTMADSDLYDSPTPFHQVLEILLRDPGVQNQASAELPQTRYFPEPIGNMVARTGWNMGVDSRDALVYMRVGGHFFGNHQRRDFGTFQVYYRGPLAIASGAYKGSNGGYWGEHWGGYYHQTLAHNGLLIFYDNEKYRSRTRLFNDGGQRVPNRGGDSPLDLQTLLDKGYRMGVVTGHGFGPSPISPEYSYICGDITAAYARKVEEVTRSMVTLNLADDAYPCALVVSDRVSSIKPGWPKIWLPHSIDEPTIDDRTITITRLGGGYAGKLVVEVLLPERAAISAVGGPGKEFWVGSIGRNLPNTKPSPAEPGAWRVEVTASAHARDARFLHVLTVMDAGTRAGPKVTAIEGTGVVGVQILDRAVVFVDPTAPAGRYSFTIRGSQDLKVLVLHLRHGVWSVQREGASGEIEVKSSQADPSVYFTGPPGRYTLLPVAKHRRASHPAGHGTVARLPDSEQ